MTPKVVTLWYRAPELLLGAEGYSPAIDIWSCGCIMAELLYGMPVFPGETEIDQLLRIYKLLGAPNDKIWYALPCIHNLAPSLTICFYERSGYSKLPMVEKLNFPSLQYNNLRAKFPDLQSEGLDLLNRMLTYDPKKRITAQEALSHPFFKAAPLGKVTELMPTFPSVHRSSHRLREKSPEAEIVQSQPHSWVDPKRIGSVFGGSLTSSASSITSSMQVDFIRQSSRESGSTETDSTSRHRNSQYSTSYQRQD